MRVSHISGRGAADCPLGALCPSVPSAVSHMLIPALGLACWREDRHQVSMQMARGRQCESATAGEGAADAAPSSQAVSDLSPVVGHVARERVAAGQRREKGAGLLAVDAHLANGDVANEWRERWRMNVNDMLGAQGMRGHTHTPRGYGFRRTGCRPGTCPPKTHRRGSGGRRWRTRCRRSTRSRCRRSESATRARRGRRRCRPRERRGRRRTRSPPRRPAGRRRRGGWTSLRGRGLRRAA